MLSKASCTNQKNQNMEKVEMIISKNSGGDGAYSKIIAARRLKIPIIIISRPKGVKTKKIYNFNSVMSWLNYKV